MGSRLDLASCTAHRLGPLLMEELRVERIRILSGVAGDAFTVTTSPLATPAHTERSGSIARGSDGSLWRSLDGGNWESLSQVILFSGTIDARFTNLSGTIDGHFNQLSGTINARFASLNNASVTGTIGMTSASLAGDTNVSSQGTIDWYIMHTSNNPPRATAAASSYSKRGGGYIRRSFDWNYAGISLTLGTNGSGPTATATITEGLMNTTVSTYQVKGRLFSTSSPDNGWGFHLRVPAETTSRVLRVQMSQISCQVVVSASLTDGSVAPVQLICGATGNGAQSNSLITVLYNSSIPNAELILTATHVGRYGTSPEILFGWATLANS